MRLRGATDQGVNLTTAGVLRIMMMFRSCLSVQKRLLQFSNQALEETSSQRLSEQWPVEKRNEGISFPILIFVSCYRFEMGTMLIPLPR